MFVGGSTQQMAGTVVLWLTDFIDIEMKTSVCAGVKTLLTDGRLTSHKLWETDFQSTKNKSAFREFNLPTIVTSSYSEALGRPVYAKHELWLWFTNWQTQRKYTIMKTLFDEYGNLFRPTENPIPFNSLFEFDSLKLLSEAFFNGNPMSFDGKNRYVMIYRAPKTIDDELDKLLESTDPFDSEQILVKMRPLCSNYVTEEIRKLRRLQWLHERMKPLPGTPSTLTHN